MLKGNPGLLTYPAPFAKLPAPREPTRLTWDGALQHLASEHLLPEDGSVVVLVHNHDLQVRGLLQGGPPQVQSEGPELVKQRAGAGTVAPTRARAAVSADSVSCRKQVRSGTGTGQCWAGGTSLKGSWVLPAGRAATTLPLLPWPPGSPQVCFERGRSDALPSAPGPSPFFCEQFWLLLKFPFLSTREILTSTISCPFGEQTWYNFQGKHTL